MKGGYGWGYVWCDWSLLFVLFSFFFLSLFIYFFFPSYLFLTGWVKKSLSLSIAAELDDRTAVLVLSSQRERVWFMFLLNCVYDGAGERAVFVILV